MNDTLTFEGDVFIVQLLSDVHEVAFTLMEGGRQYRRWSDGATLPPSAKVTQTRRDGVRLRAFGDGGGRQGGPWKERCSQRCLRSTQQAGRTPSRVQHTQPHAHIMQRKHICQLIILSFKGGGGPGVCVTSP